MNPLLGKTIIAVWLADDWIENVENPTALLGTVQTAEDLNLPDDAEPDSDGEVVKRYGFKIETEKGTCTMDYRNSSNGYYGGDLSWPNDNYFYGGVYGQNISKEEWQQIA